MEKWLNSLSIINLVFFLSTSGLGTSIELRRSFGEFSLEIGKNYTLRLDKELLGWWSKPGLQKFLPKFDWWNRFVRFSLHFLVFQYLNFWITYLFSLEIQVCKFQRLFVCLFIWMLGRQLQENILFKWTGSVLYMLYLSSKKYG